MSHLLAISVGPVQEFIAAARRTRDLWFGSHLLSEISKAVARAVEPHGTLIFPHPGTDLRANNDAVNVANVILTELRTGDPKAIAATAKAAALEQWKEFAKQAYGTTSTVIRREFWANQVDDVIEFYAAWTPGSEDYQQDRTRVMRLLAGRKSCRDFGQPAFNDVGLPKSSLDGQRPTVLVGPKAGEKPETYRDTWPIEIRRSLRLSSGEQLDAVGVAKRVAGGNQSYPSVARVAAETWLRGMRKQSRLDPLKRACEKLSAKGLRKVREDSYNFFPHEGTIIYKDRHPDIQKELGLGVRDLDEVATEIGKLGGGDPLPYVAVLVADGDGMGAVISNRTSIGEHQQLSQALAGFADQARTVVAEHSGVLVYAGGDDVLAFLPVNKCLDCARELHDQFGGLLKEYKNGKGQPPTLSVGIAIGHFMENLEDLRDYGRQAERAAKEVEGKDALAVHVHKRGGAPIRVRGKWGDKPPRDKQPQCDKLALNERLRHLAELIRTGAIPGKLSYDLREMAQVYECWPQDQAEAAIAIDFIRLVAKKQSRGAKTVRERLSPYRSGMNARRLLDLADELLVARLIATALEQAGEETRCT